MRVGRKRGVAVWVPGHPKTQGSHRIVVTPQGGARVIDAAKGLSAWRRTVATVVASKARRPFEGPVHVAALFYLPAPKRGRTTLPATRPDLDKLARALLDGLTAGGVIRDDGQVVDLAVGKRWATKEPGCFVRVQEIAGDEPRRRTAGDGESDEPRSG